MARYKVILESQSGHCCFEATVVDTLKPLHDFKGDNRFEQICETHELTDAKLICQALNDRILKSNKKEEKKCK